MQISETERLMLVRNKETICGATMKILRLANDPKNIAEIKENFSIILQLVNTIASYCNPKNCDLNQFTEATNVLFDLMTKEKETDMWTISANFIGDAISNYANSIRFDFTKKELKLTFAQDKPQFWKYYQ